MNDLICMGKKAKAVRYIKLGSKGKWEEGCFTNGIIRFEFDTDKKEVMDLALARNWESLKEYWSRSQTNSASSDSVRQMKDFFEDDGSTLWIAFSIVKHAMWYGFTDGNDPSPDTNGCIKKMDVNGWRSIDANGRHLSKDELSGNLTKTEGYRATICKLDNTNTKYVIDRINGKCPDVVVQAHKAREGLINSIEKLLSLLHPTKDFELLVELIFAESGWKRQSPTGKTQKAIDILLWQPISDTHAVVQVKAKTTQHELNEYIEKNKELDIGVMFYIYHTSDKPLQISNEDQEVITLWDGRKVAEQVVRNGLVDWLIKKTS